MVKRRSGRLLPLELDIVECGLSLQNTDGSFYGFALARELADRAGAGLTAHGTLYKALARMRDSGLLEASWEDAEAAERENRPRRRLYRVTGTGELAGSAERTALAAEQRSAARAVPIAGLTPGPARSAMA